MKRILSWLRYRRVTIHSLNSDVVQVYYEDRRTGKPVGGKRP